MDFRKEAIYPSEIGVVSCTKGFISISRTFIEKSFIGNRQVYVKVKRNYKFSKLAIFVKSIFLKTLFLVNFDRALSEARGGNTIVEKMGNNQIVREVSRNRRLKGKAIKIKMQLLNI
ncbi:MAG: hypothetical protein K8R28_09415 [Desulfobacterales bacterium]|nr:hypothetical protein [Desulfobacterales bacterium]